MLSDTSRQSDCDLLGSYVRNEQDKHHRISGDVIVPAFTEQRF